MPPPLGPQAAVSFPLAICHLAPLHAKVTSFRTYSTVDAWQRIAMKATMPAVAAALSSGAVRSLVNKVVDRLPEGPGDAARERGKWTILAEASTADGAWRNVVLTGTDVYGLTGRTLATAATTMAADGYSGKGVLAPVQAAGLDTLRRELEDFEVRISHYAAENEK
jgi:short subunit dehydrogenase-like uncharacterized protein